MRLALDATPLIGPGTGVASFTRGAARALAAAAGLDVIAYGLTARGRGALAHVVPSGVAVATRPMPAGVLQRLWSRADVAPIEWWTGAVDVVHGTNFVVPPTRGAAAVVTVHDLTAVRFPELCTPASLRYPDLIRRAVRRGAWVHTPSEAVADEVVALLGAPPERVRAVHSGLEPPSRSGDGRAGRFLAGSDRYVLALGTIEPRKGLPGLVAAFDRIAEERPDLGLAIAGPDGWGIDAFNDAVATSRSAGRVRRIGRVNDQQRADLLAGAAVLALPSIYEGFGYPGLEAMASGAPVVATDAGALREVLAEAALLVPVGDVDALAGALAAVLDDETTAHRLRETGPARAASFTWDRWLGQMRELYAAATGTQG